MDLEYSFRGKHIAAIGEWLDENMPNPLLPEPQRWTIGYMNNGTDRCGIHFADDMDATLFALRWTGYDVL